jgi:transcriptional regulator with XRE-family HTH domain
MRSKLGFSQGQIAEQLGLTLAEYQECESGMRRYGAGRLLKLARLMDVAPQYRSTFSLAAGSVEFLN